jgi:microcompartment protein CcmK/EutM
MEIALVKGRIVSTRKDPLFTGLKLLYCEALNPDTMKPKGLDFVAVDTVDAGVGDVVLIVRGSPARVATGLKNKPIDASIVGIVETVAMQDTVTYKKS